MKYHVLVRCSFVELFCHSMQEGNKFYHQSILIEQFNGMKEGNKFYHESILKEHFNRGPVMPLQQQASSRRYPADLTGSSSDSNRRGWGGGGGMGPTTSVPNHPVRPSSGEDGTDYSS